MSKLYTLFVGVGNDRTGRELSNEERHMGIAAMKSLIVAEFGGYSAESVKGGYRYHDGSTVEENSERIQIMASNDDAWKVRAVACKCRDIMQQESVLLTSQVVESEFV